VRTPPSEVYDKLGSYSRGEEDPFASSQSVKDLSRLMQSSGKDSNIYRKQQRGASSDKKILNRNKQSPGLMKDYFSLVDGGQSEDLYRSNDRFRTHEEKHSQEVENLKKEVSSWRQRIEQSTNQHRQTLKSMKEDYELRLYDISDSKAKEISVLNSQILDIETELDHEKRRSFRSSEEMSLNKITHQEEESQLKSRVKNLTSEVGFLKDKLEGIYYREIATLNKEIKSTQQQYTKEIEYIRQNYRRQSDEYRSRIRAKDSMLETLEAEVSDLKHQFESRFDNIQTSIAQLESSLIQTQIQENDYYHKVESIKSARDKARKESDLLSEEAQVLESQLEIEVELNKELQEKLDKLGKKVYGRGYRGS
jgi:chromosome segregation ATPase